MGDLPVLAPGSQVRVFCPTCGKAVVPRSDGWPRSHFGRRGTKDELRTCSGWRPSGTTDSAPADLSGEGQEGGSGPQMRGAR